MKKIVCLSWKEIHFMHLVPFLFYETKHYNCVRFALFQIYVSLAGMMCVGLSLLFAYGLATAMNLIYSPIQSIMPFMLLGVFICLCVCVCVVCVCVCVPARERERERE